MKNIYMKNEVLFAVLWIIVYCAASIPIRGTFGDGSGWMTIVLLAITIGATIFVKKYHLEEKYGLSGWPKNAGRYQIGRAHV